MEGGGKEVEGGVKVLESRDREVEVEGRKWWKVEEGWRKFKGVGGKWRRGVGGGMGEQMWWRGD